MNKGSASLFWWVTGGQWKRPNVLFIMRAAVCACRYVWMLSVSNSAFSFEKKKTSRHTHTHQPSDLQQLNPVQLRTPQRHRLFMSDRLFDIHLNNEIHWKSLTMSSQRRTHSLSSLPVSFTSQIFGGYCYISAESTDKRSFVTLWQDCSIE